MSDTDKNPPAVKKAKTKSTIRVPMQSVVVVRDGKSTVPPIGQPFDFTAEEIAQIEKMNPDAISDRATVSVDALDKDDGGKADL